MEKWIFLLSIIIGFFSIELCVRTIVVFVNKKFQWLIIKTDEYPKLSKEGLKKFFDHGYEPELGWVRKPNTFHEENGKFGKTEWSINSKGSRRNPGFEEQEIKISCYGDSFTFCRQVNDEETWAHYLSEKTHTNVLNFGVGNYGMDQALLRLKKEFRNNKSEIVILGLVPDTISRIVSSWKHYYEYGNTFAFKPRFILKDNVLHLIENSMKEFSNFYEYEKYLKNIRKYDYFYEKKFKKEIIFFPYSITIFRNFKRNFKIIYWILKIHFTKKELKKNLEWNPMQIIMRTNLEWRLRLFEEKSIVLLLKKIIEEFIDFSKKNNFKPCLVFLPQKDDILFIKNNFHFYKKITDELSNIKNFNIIDITNEFVKIDNLDELYSDQNEYGGHYSKLGNKKVSEIIYDQLKI